MKYYLLVILPLTTIVIFVAQARHFCDMGHLDGNYSMMLSGNDGWLDNSHRTGQVELPKDGVYMWLTVIPLWSESVAFEPLAKAVQMGDS